MNKWIPRIVAIVFIAFMSIFSFDVFADYTGWELVVAFLLHNIPVFILIGILILSWKKPRLGGQIFIIAGVIMTIFFKTYTDIINFLLISLPVFALGLAFFFARDKKLPGKRKRQKKLVP